MKIKLPLQTSILMRTELIVLAIVATILAAMSGLIYPSPYSPLLFLGGIVAIVTFISCLLRPVWALYAAIFIIFLPLGLIPTNIQSMLNRSMTILAMGAWLLGWLIRRHRIRWTIPAVLMGCFLAWSAITLFWAKELSPGITILQAYTLRLILFLFLIANEIRTKKDLDGLMSILVFVGWLLMVVSINAILLNGYTAGSRFTVFQVNENEIGTLAMISMLGILWQTTRPSRLMVFLASIFLLLTIGLIAISGSRGSALALAVTLIGFWMWRSSRSWGRLGFIFLILAVIFVPSMFITSLERFLVTSGDTLLGGREILWKSAWQLISKHPLGGVGIGNAPYAIMQYLETDSRVVDLDRVSIHNPILTIWSETGVPGIIFYLGVLASASWSFIQQYMKHRKNNSYFLNPYFAFVASIFSGYLFTWFKGGGMESGYSYFLMLALLMIPSCLNSNDLDNVKEIGNQIIQG